MNDVTVQVVGKEPHEFLEVRGARTPVAIGIIQWIHDGQLEAEERPQNRTQIPHDGNQTDVGLLKISQNPGIIDMANGH
jgi:hypothetical protein